MGKESTRGWTGETSCQNGSALQFTLVLTETRHWVGCGINLGDPVPASLNGS